MSTEAEPVAAVTGSASDVATATVKTTKKLPKLILKGVVVFFGILGGRLAAKVVPKVWKFSETTTGSAVSTVISGVVSALVSKEKGIAEFANLFTIGSAGSLAESLINDAAVIFNLKKEEGDVKAQKGTFPPLDIFVFSEK